MIWERLRPWTWCEWTLAGIFFLTLPLVNPYIRGDGNEYFAYVRSLVVDGDLNFENEYRRGDPLFRQAAFDENGNVVDATLSDHTLGRLPTGYLKNNAAIGSSLLWMPAFLAAHVATKLLNAAGVQVLADGYSAPYRWACGLETALFSFIGLFLSFRVACRLTDSRTALLATVGIWFASSLPVYMYFLPFHVPAMTSFTVALFVWYWWRTSEGRSVKQWAIWGALAGLTITMYASSAVFLVMAMADLAWRANDGGLIHCRDAAKRKTILIAGIVFVIAAVAVLTPQFIIKSILHGAPFDLGVRRAVHWFAPSLWAVGFSREHGLFSWTPILLPAVIGLCLYWRQDRWRASVLLTVVGLFYYLAAIHGDWSGGSSFGNRFFVSFTSVFVIGLAIGLHHAGAWLRRGGFTRPIPLQAAVFAAMIAWNVGFIFQWGTNLVPNRGPVDFGVVARNQFTVVPQKMASFVKRYFISRSELTNEIEMEDVQERSKQRR